MNEYPSTPEAPSENPENASAGARTPEWPIAFDVEPSETVITPGDSLPDDNARGAFQPEGHIDAAAALSGATEETPASVYKTPHMSIEVGAPDPGGTGSRSELSMAGDGGVEMVQLPNGLFRFDRTLNMKINGMAVQDRAFVIVDARGEIIGPENPEEPPRESLFTFARPLHEGYEPVDRAERREARILMGGIHGLVTGMYPNNRVLDRLTPGLSSSTIRKKDVVIMGITCEPGSKMVKQYGLQTVQLAERVPHGLMGDVVQYTVDEAEVPRRWHKPAISSNERYRQDWLYNMQQLAANEQGPKVAARVEAEIYAERMADLEPNKQQAAQRGENFLPVGVEEIRAFGQFVGEKLGIADEMQRVIG